MGKKLFYLLLLLLCVGSSYAQSLKSVSVLGDSYSTYEGYMHPDANRVYYLEVPDLKTDVVSVRQTWWYKFIKENNYRLCVNNSFSGATVCNTGYGKEDYSDRSFLTRMKDLGNPDMILIFGGTNDSWAGVPMGCYQYEGWTKDDLYEFRPAMSYMLDYLGNRYPNVDIYFLLNTGLSEEIDESVKAICKHYGVGCVELQDIDKQSDHPSVKGMEQICRQLADFIAKKKNE